MSDLAVAQHGTGGRDVPSVVRRPACAPSRRAAPAALQTFSRAFTLVEVLAALLLVAIVIPVVMQGISLATTAASSAKRRTEAASLAQSKMAELVATDGWSGGVLSGSFDVDDGNEADAYSWQADVSAWTEPYVKLLAVHVMWDGTDGQRSVTLSTLVYEGLPEEEVDAGEVGSSAGAAGGGL